MGTREVKFDFFSVKMPPKTPPLTKLMDQHFPNNHQRLTHGGNYYRLEAYGKRGLFRLGSMIKMVDSALPAKAHLKKPGIQPLPLADEEAIAGETVFLYAPATNVLVLQRNSSGASSGAVVRLFEHLLGIKDLDLEYILDYEAYNKYSRMKVFRTIQVKATFPQDHMTYKDETTKTAMRMSKALGGSYISVQVGMGHSKGTLFTEPLQGMVEDLLHLRKAGVKVDKVEVSGKDFEDGETQAVDLLTERMIAEIEVPLTARRLERGDLFDAVHRAYDEHEKELASYAPITG